MGETIDKKLSNEESNSISSLRNVYNLFSSISIDRKANNRRKYFFVCGSKNLYFPVFFLVLAQASRFRNKYLKE